MQITIYSKGIQQGPFPAEQVRQLLQSGQLAPSDLGWSPGMAEWKPLSSFPELQGPSAASPGRAGEGPPSIIAKTEPLAIWSLVLGIISVIGCAFGGIIAGIPAIICGHIGRSKIQNNSTLRGAGMALAGIICGYLSVAIVPVAIIAAIAIPNIASITQQANEAKAMRNAQNFASLASAAKAAGYTGKWATKEDAMRELVEGITVRVGSQEYGPFHLTGLTPTDINAASQHLELEGDNLVYAP